jgi:hypothetical protein
MSQASAILRRGVAGFFHWCPACQEMHPLPDSWTFNRDVERPTFSPSFKQTFTHWPDRNDVTRGEERVCHYFICDGQIQFCFDSWHKRSDVVAMPQIPAHLRDTFSHETQD